MTRQLILVPAVITLAVTVIRLVGELLRWSPTFFSREAGGAGALIGIVWLVPVFGVYFARKLLAAGEGPAGAGRALGYAVLALALLPLTVLVARRLPMGARIGLFAVASLVGAAVAWRGWPALGRTLVAYGLAARIPVAVVMLVAMTGGWGTHYELGPPGLPPMGVLPKWLLIGLLPQLTFWIGFTVIVGSIFGAVAAMVVRGRARAPALP